MKIVRFFLKPINNNHMKTLQLSEQKTRELYRSGSKELKTVLEESFGKDFFSQDVTERVKHYDYTYQ